MGAERRRYELVHFSNTQGILVVYMVLIFIRFRYDSVYCTRAVQERDGLFYVRIAGLLPGTTPGILYDQYKKFSGLSHIEVHRSLEFSTTAYHGYVGFATLESARYAIQQGKFRNGMSSELTLVWDWPAIDPDEW